MSVDPNGPASRTGLDRGDIVVALDDVPVTGVDDLLKLLSGERVGQAVNVSYLRRGDLRRVNVTPIERQAA